MLSASLSVSSGLVQSEVFMGCYGFEQRSLSALVLHCHVQMLNGMHLLRVTVH